MLTFQGGIYTNYFKEALRNRLGSGASESTIDSVYNSIVASDLPSWGTPERIAANSAVSVHNGCDESNINLS